MKADPTAYCAVAAGCLEKYECSCFDLYYVNPCLREDWSLQKYIGLINFGLSYFVCLLSAQKPSVGQGLLIHEVSRTHTTTHHSR